MQKEYILPYRIVYGVYLLLISETEEIQMLHYVIKGCTYAFSVIYSVGVCSYIVYLEAILDQIPLLGFIRCTKSDFTGN